MELYVLHARFYLYHWATSPQERKTFDQRRRERNEHVPMGWLLDSWGFCE